jgi:hypothetical protein
MKLKKRQNWTTLRARMLLKKNAERVDMKSDVYCTRDDNYEESNSTSGWLLLKKREKYIVTLITLRTKNKKIRFRTVVRTF